MVALLLLLVGCGGCGELEESIDGVGDELCEDTPQVAAGEADVRALTFNIGTADYRDTPYALSLRSQVIEDSVAAFAQSLDLDIIALQETLAASACEGFEETDAGRTCYEADASAAERVAGEGYAVVCDTRSGRSCLAVRRSWGTIVGFDGEGVGAATTEPLPGEACDGLAGACEPEGSNCDTNSDVSWVDVETEGLGRVRVINVHLSAHGDGCRARQTAQVEALGEGHQTIVLGDWNYDPDESGDGVDRWEEMIEQTPFVLHNPRTAEFDGCQPIETYKGRALDLVTSNFLEGTCEVHGEPPIERVEGEAVPDHSPVSCSLARR